MLEDKLNFSIGDKQISAYEILTGDMACEGDLNEGEYVSGIVRLITKNHNKIEGLQEFSDGEIIVTEMTDPSMENEMARASAFITDKGGETCHAAMIARDLNKLCIIGTNYATTKLKTGEKIYLSYRLAKNQEGEYLEGVILR